MDVRTLCLGVLSQGDYTGYDIKKYFESSFASFFPAGYGSIYPALAQLLEQGFVSCVPQPQDKLPDKKIYTITDAGVEQFKNALGKGKGKHKLRSEFLVQMFFSEHLPAQSVTNLLDQRLEQINAEMDDIANTVSARNNNETAGAAFARGFNKAILQAGRDYIVENRMLVEFDASEKVTNIDGTVARIAG